jgi:hypothetical protein
MQKQNQRLRNMERMEWIVERNSRTKTTTQITTRNEMKQEQEDCWVIEKRIEESLVCLHQDKIWTIQLIKFNTANLAEIDRPKRKGEGQNLFLESNALSQIHSN